MAVACLALVATLTAATRAAEPAASANAPLDRAIAHLGREVPRWFHENRCFSCHNNGDGARALYQARAMGHEIPLATLENTAPWLAQSERWDREVGNADFKDDRLARVQFAATLAVAARSKDAALTDSLRRAAARLARDQADDGSWPMESAGVGGPTTYNTTLATHLARGVLQRADAAAYQQALARSQEWLERRKLANVLDAAVILWALASTDTPAAQSQQKTAIELIRQGENSGGGWGPYLTSAAEPFDTAIVLLALAAQDDSSLEPLRKRGRSWLIDQQLADGGWLATTRPPGGDSYAQSISTTAWCLQALLATEP